MTKARTRLAGARASFFGLYSASDARRRDSAEPVATTAATTATTIAVAEVAAATAPTTAAAAAAAAAAAVATAAEATTATATAATWPAAAAAAAGLALTSLVHDDLATVERLAIHAVDRLGAFLGRRELDESKPPRTAAHSIDHHESRGDIAELTELVPQRVFGRRIRQVAHVQSH